MRRRTILAAALVALLALSGCGGGSGDDTGDAAGDASPDSSEPAPRDLDEVDYSLVAHAQPAQVQVYASASEDEPTVVLDNPNENGAPLVFLVEDDLGDWLQVLLPIRPNGSTGFIRTADVELARNSYSIDIELSAHRLTVTKGDEVIADEVIGVGTAATPTPGGKYYLKELLEPPDPNGVYGPYAYGLSGFSNVLEEFNGGPGVIGLHGTNQPELLGTDVSKGCIRMSNEAITKLAEVLPLGTPVHIEA
jgi:lipoprotein-anchoring transpeptidase ErfK/SrfK